MDMETSESDTSKGLKNEDPNHRLWKYFRSAAKTTVKKYLSTFTFKVFKECYPELVAFNRKQCKLHHRELVTQLGTSITEGLNDLFENDRVFQALRRLDQIIMEQKDRQIEGWTPSGNPEEDLRDHLYKEKLMKKEKLLQIYQDVKTESEALNQQLSENHNAIQEARREIMSLNSEINVHFKELMDVCKNPLEPDST